MQGSARRHRNAPQRHDVEHRRAAVQAQPDQRAPVQQLRRRNRPRRRRPSAVSGRPCWWRSRRQHGPVERHASARCGRGIALDRAHRALRLAVGGQEGAADILAQHAQDHRLHAARPAGSPSSWRPSRTACRAGTAPRRSSRRRRPRRASAMAAPAKTASRSGASEKLVARFSHSRTRRAQRVVGAALGARQMRAPRCCRCAASPA